MSLLASKRTRKSYATILAPHYPIEEHLGPLTGSCAFPQDDMGLSLSTLSAPRQDEHLVVGAASRLRSLGLLRHGDFVAVAFRPTIECRIVIRAVVQCEAFPILLHTASTQNELEHCLSEYQVRLLLTGPGDNQYPAAQAAAVGVGVPNFAVSVDVSSGLVDISPLFLPPTSGLLGGPAADGSIELPVLHNNDAPGGAAGVWVVNVGQTDTGGDAGDFGAPQGEPPASTVAEVVAGATAAESSPRLNEILTLSQGGMVGVGTALLNKDPNSAEMASLSMLFFYMAWIFAMMGLVFKAHMGGLQAFFPNVSRILFFCGAATLAAILPDPVHRYTAVAISLAAVVGAPMLLLLSRVRKGKSEGVPSHADGLVKGSK